MSKAPRGCGASFSLKRTANPAAVALHWPHLSPGEEDLLARPEAKRSKTNPAGPLPEIPEKLYFRIGEVSRLLDLPAYVLRFWESEFPQLKPGKGGTGQRLYRRRDVETALEIRCLLYDEGYTIPGARQLLQGNSRTSKPQPPAPQPAPVESRPQIRRLRQELQEIAGILSRPVLPRRANAARSASRQIPLPLVPTTERKV